MASNNLRPLKCGIEAAESSSAHMSKPFTLILVSLTLLGGITRTQVPVRKPSPSVQQAPVSRPPSTQPAVTAKMSQAQLRQRVLQPIKTPGPKIPNPHASTRAAEQSALLATLKRQANSAAAERNQVRPEASVSQPLNHSSSKVVAPEVIPHGSASSRTPQVQAIPETCLQGKISVSTINGLAPRGIVFASEVGGAGGVVVQYSFLGCNFGSQPGQLSLVGPFKRSKIPFNIANWTDQRITAALDLSVSGEPDQNNNVTFVLTRADGQRLELDGNGFYARRTSITLSAVPQGWVTLATIRDASGAVLTPEYQTATPTTSSATVGRYSANSFGAGQDVFDLSHINSQFTIDSMQLLKVSGQSVCITSEVAYVAGAISAQWDGENIRVTSEGTTCQGTTIGAAAFSLYTLQVQVTGPAGLDPALP